MKRDAGGEAVAAVQSYIYYLQRLGVTELPVTLAPPLRTVAVAPPARASATTLPTQAAALDAEPAVRLDRKSTRLNSSH